MKKQASPIARGGQEAGIDAEAAQFHLRQRLGQRTDGNGPDLQRHLAHLAALAQFRLVFQFEVQNRQTGRGVAQRASFDQSRGEDQPVQACGAGAGARRCSSLSAAFIISDGVVIALSRATVR